MSESNNADGKTGIVVERLTARRLSAAVSNPCKWLVSALAAMLALIMWITPVGLADETGEDTDPDLDGGALTSSITDTENLLGSNVTEVTDAIDQLHEQTGVSVRLLYLSSFSAGEGQVDQWASDVLESTDPEPNTVLLAVASHDGNLVVAVSANSDEWLHRQSTVDELSQAALDPLVENDTPDWSASALDMIEQINVVYRTATSPSVIVIGAAALGGVVVILAIVVVVMLVRRRRRRQPSDETEPAETTETVAEDTGLSEAGSRTDRGDDGTGRIGTGGGDEADRDGTGRRIGTDWGTRAGFPEIPLAVAQETAWPSQRLTSTYSEHSGKRQSKG